MSVCKGYFSKWIAEKRRELCKQKGEFTICKDCCFCEDEEKEASK